MKDSRLVRKKRHASSRRNISSTQALKDRGSYKGSRKNQGAKKSYPPHHHFLLERQVGNVTKLKIVLLGYEGTFGFFRTIFSIVLKNSSGSEFCKISGELRTLNMVYLCIKNWPKNSKKRGHCVNFFFIFFWKKGI